MKDNSLFITLSIFLILGTSGFYWSCNSLYESEAEMKRKIGTNFILEKDTLLVVDYSLLDETFTLSNSKKVSKELILNPK